MNYVVTNQQMKLAEQASNDNGTSFLELMKNAGNACFDKISKIIGGAADKSFVILAGRGNNGGDGIVIAKKAIENGGAAVVLFVEDLPNSQCARECYNLYENDINTALYTHREDIAKKALASCDVIVDCVFGTGFHGQLEDKIADLFRYINSECKALKVSVDVPSGCNSDTGEIAKDAFKPDVTLTLASVKQGLLNHPCFDYCGNLVLLNIGIEDRCYVDYEAVLSDKSILELIPARKKSSHKGTYGRLLNISGSGNFTGAALLSTKAALRVGTGLITLATPKRVVNAIACAVPETTYLPLEQDDDGFMESDCTEQLDEYIPHVTAIAMGCGMGNNSESKQIVEHVLKKATCPLILDADGINSIVGNINVLKDNKAHLIITPHPAEFGRLVNLPAKEIQSQRLALAKSFAREHKLVVVLKGANTIIASPDGRAFVNTTGNAGLAKGGSGDVLTGIIAGFAAQGVEPFSAAVLGVYLHGLAADELAKKMSMAGMLPSDVVEILPFIMK